MRYAKPQILETTGAGRMIQTNHEPKIAPFQDNSGLTPSSPAAYEADE
jgi:hypothetical protein